jgi:putative ABC transport system permease protein
MVDSTFFNMFDFTMKQGDRKNTFPTGNSIVVTEASAKKYFGKGPAVGKNIELQLSGEWVPFTVASVVKDVPLESSIQFDMLISFANARRFFSEKGMKQAWSSVSLETYVLLKEGASATTANAKIPAVMDPIVAKNYKPGEYKVTLQPLTDIHLDNTLPARNEPVSNPKYSTILATIGLLVLLIACINFVTLSIGRSTTRSLEVGVRKVLGAERQQLVKQFWGEALLLTFISFIIGLLLAFVCLKPFNQLADRELIIIFRKSLVVFQFVITVVMIAGSFIIYRQLQYASKKDLGFNKEQVLTFHIDDRNVRTQTDALKTQLLQNPLIEAVGVAGNPIGNNDIGGMGYNFETQQGSFSISTTMSQELMVDADYIPTMQIKMLAGRNFSDAIQSDKYGAALINETLVKHLGWTNPIGKRMKFSIDEKGTMGERTVVGVIKDFHTYSLQHKVDPLVMVMPPAPSMGDNMYVRISKGKINDGLAYINKVYSRFDKNNPIEYHFLDANFAKQYSAETKQGQMAFIFTVLAVLIACLGLFGLAAFTAEQRTKEIGVRKVLGASVASIVQMLSSDFLKLVLVASCIAIPLAWLGINKWLQDFAYHINIGWWMLPASCMLALVIALLTVSFQAIKAAVANPVKSLRTE